MFGSRALQTEQGGCPGIPLCWVQGRGMHAAKQPLKFLCFPSLLMAGGKLTDWQPLQNQDVVSPPRFSATISSFPIHLGHTHARIQSHGFISHGHPPKPTAKAHLLRLLSCMHVAEAWSVQAAMFMQMVAGFRLKSKLDEKFLRKQVLEFASRRDMPKPFCFPLMALFKQIGG